VRVFQIVLLAHQLVEAPTLGVLHKFDACPVQECLFLGGDNGPMLHFHRRRVKIVRTLVQQNFTPVSQTISYRDKKSAMASPNPFCSAKSRLRCR